MSRKETLVASHWGLMHVEVENDCIVSVRPHAADRFPSPNLKAAAELARSPRRIATPCVREGWLKNGPGSGEGRGRERFVPISWDEAIALVARELERTYTESGPNAVFGHSYGWMSAGRVHACNTLQRRLLNLAGGFVRCENSYSTAAVAKILPYVIGVSDPRSSAWQTVLDKSELVVFWGADPLVTNDIDWGSTLHSGKARLRELKARGTATVSVNPVRTETAKLLGSSEVRVRPGTDTALVFGLVHELLASGRADLDFMKRATSGWEDFLDEIAGRHDGVEKTPAWAARICGVPEAEIKAFSARLAAHRTMIMTGWGPQRARFGEMFHRALYGLAAALGQIGLPGGGIGTNYHYCSGGEALTRAPRLGGLDSKPAPLRTPKEPPLAAIPTARFVDAFLHPGKTIDFNGRRVTYPDVKIVLWTGGNPFAHQPGTPRLLEAWRRPETVVVSEILWTATARHADIVLPAATFFERNDIVSIGNYANEGVACSEAALSPYAESLSDYEIHRRLAAALGLEEAFTEGLDEMGWIRRLYEAQRAEGAAMGVAMPDFEEFRRTGLVRFEADEAAKHFVAFEAFRRDPEAHPLTTESGRIVLSSDIIAGYGYEDAPGGVRHLAPVDAPETDARHPLVLLSVKSARRLHGQLDGTEAVRGADPDGHEPCLLHPADAAARGIETGDEVCVFNARGRILVRAEVTDDIREGCVLVRHGAWFEPAEDEAGMIDLRGASNVLTPDAPTSKLACGNIASGARVEATKYRGR